MAAQDSRFDYNHSTVMGTTFGANEQFSDKNGLQGWYGQAAAPSVLSSAPYGNSQAERGGLAEPLTGSLSGTMSAVSGYQGILSEPLSLSTGFQDPLSAQRGPISGYGGLSSALPYSGRQGALSDRRGSEDRMGFSVSSGYTPDYNKGTFSLTRGITPGDMDTFPPYPHAFDSQRPPGLHGPSPASNSKSYKDFQYMEDYQDLEYSEEYENPRELEHMAYEKQEKLNQQEVQEENEDLEGLGDFMLNRYVLPSQQDTPCNTGVASSRSEVQVRNKGRISGRREENTSGFSPRSGAKMHKERQPGGPCDTLQRGNRQAYRGHASPLRRSPTSYPVRQSGRRSPLLSHQANLSETRTSHDVRKEYSSVSHSPLYRHQEHPSRVSAQKITSRGPAAPLELFSDATHFESFADNSGSLDFSRRSERHNEAPSYSAPRGLSPAAPSRAAQWPDRYGPPSSIPPPFSEPLLPIHLLQDSDPGHSSQWRSESVYTSRMSHPPLSVLRGTRSTDLRPTFIASDQSHQDTPTRIWEKSDLTCVRIRCNMSTPEDRDEKPMMNFRQHFRSWSPPSSRQSNEHSHRRTRQSRSPLPFQPQDPFMERLDRHNRSPHSSSRYQSSHRRGRRSRSRSEHSSMLKYKFPQQHSRSNSPISTVPRRQSPHSQTSAFRGSPLQSFSRSRRQSPQRQDYRDSGRSPPRYHSRGRSAHRSHARSRSPLPLAYQLKNQSPNRLGLQKRSRNQSCPRMASKGRSRSRHHSPSDARCKNSRSPRSKKNSPLRKTTNSKTSLKTKSQSPETSVKKSRGCSTSRSSSSRNESKSIKGRSPPVSPSKKLSATNGGKKKSPTGSLSNRSVQSRHSHIKSPPRLNPNSLSRLSTSESQNSQNVFRPHENQSSSSRSTDRSSEQTKQTAKTGVNNNNEKNLPSEDRSHTAVSQSVSKEPLLSTDHSEHVQRRAVSPSLKETRLLQSTESLDDPVKNAKSPSLPQQHFGVIIWPFPLSCSDKDISFKIFRIFKTFGHVTSIEVHDSGENRFCVVFYRDPDGQKSALSESGRVEPFNEPVSVAAWHHPENENRVVFRPSSQNQAQQANKATKTLLIRNLDAKLSRGDIHLRFQAFGKILEINLKKKLYDRGCYAFVQYSDIISVTRAIKEMDGVLIGDCKVKLSYGNTEPTECVWVDCLNGISESVLTKLFSRHGPVSKVVMDDVNKKALVFFFEVESAKKAIGILKGMKLFGYSVMMDFANRECQTDFYGAMKVTN